MTGSAGNERIQRWRDAGSSRDPPVRSRIGAAGTRAFAVASRPHDFDKRDPIDARLARAFAEPDPTKGRAAGDALAKQLEREHPDAAASLREGLDEMVTVARLGISGRLRQSLTNTNCIDSMISICRTSHGRVKRWRDGEMKNRWIAAGMLEAERSFRRLGGHADMSHLVAAIGRAANPAIPDNYDQAAA